MREIKVVGHKIPDTDCVLSAIIACDYLEKKGYNKATPYIQGGVNKETEYLLRELNIEKPEIKTNFPAGTNICLVDHNEEFQTLDNLSELNVEWVIDHHKLKFETATPLNMRVEPICSTGSILYKMYKESDFKITKEIGTMMLACILSDSLLFRSATTTKEDIILAEELKEITGIHNFEEFAMPMFNAKSDLGNMEIEKVVKYDYKEFDFNGIKAGIGTLETTNPGYGLGRKDEILGALEKIKKEDNLDFIMLSIVDIIGEKNTTIILDGKDSEVLEKVFNIKIENNLADLKNRLSRKKQVVPELTKYFA
ncbi:MAG: manganese-dependent inorganic pyrophosphatase [Candidatus Gracilibacteria bacterium]|nr:manganese-dependent inorganic pyrophosphatase [Candidatus Gracilibacteria bacterium]MDQ7022236.1 manganese-dependent inorganic pyrophosphatase [Candidatus Gracilibacteria bacterium]